MSTLDNFRREAKRWLHAIRAGDVDALERLHRAHPDTSQLPTLRDVHHALAREHGHASWAAMRTALDRAPVAVDPSNTALSPERRIAAFLESASPHCEVRGPSNRRMHFEAAMRFLTRHPDLATANIYTAVVCGDVAEVARILAMRPDASSEPGGPHGWPPLLYLCNARLAVAAAGDNAVAIAQLLLDAGANPNARYILHGTEEYPYSALTGVLGRGEEEAATHPNAEALARLLLERGAEPYDTQMLYNVFADNSSRALLGDDMVWLLDLIYEHSVKRGRVADWNDPEWPMLDPWGRGRGAALLLEAATSRNLVEMTDWLLAHGARPQATPAKEDPNEQAFIAACFRLDRAHVATRLASDPDSSLAARAMFAAARHDRADVVELLLDLGVSPDIERADQGHARTLHEAAGADAAHVIALLVARGAAIDARESNWNATPLGFAAFGLRQRAIDELALVSRDVFNLTFVGKVERVRELLDADPALATTVKPNGATPLMWLPDDELRALEIIELFLSHGADPAARTSEGRTARDVALERGLDLAAARLAGTPS